jgi:hypothetical protein
MKIFTENSWKPIKHSILKDAELASKINEIGYSIKSMISPNEIDAIMDLFTQNHQIKDKNGGMFYSIYSQDTDYRKKIHFTLGEILKPIINSLCKDYKILLNSFVVKISGPGSEFYLHQDTTSLDEWKFSPLSLWIPLEDVNEKNGCLGVIPKSHHMFSPYRSISFPAPFDAIQSTVKQYLQPIPMKKGDILLFDNRILHHSYTNTSDKIRIAVICGLFPKEATLQTCFKPTYECGGEVEIIEHEDDYLLNGKNFLIDCQKRPQTGTSIGWNNDPYESISKETFEQLCNNFKIKKIVPNTVELPTNCNMIGEPIHG